MRSLRGCSEVSQRRASILALAALIGCAPVAAPPHATTNGPVPRPQVTAHPVPLPPSTQPAAPADTGGQPGVGAPRVAQPGPGLRLELPVDAAGLARPLPAEDPALAATFRERSRITVGKGYLQELDLFPGGNTLLVSSAEDGTVWIYERASGRRLGRFTMDASDPGTNAVVAWPETSPDGTPLFVKATGDGLVLFSAATGARVARLDSVVPSRLRWSPDRSVLVAAAAAAPNQGQALHFYRRVGLDLKPSGVLRIGERVDAWDLSRDHRLLALSLYPSGDVEVVDLQTGADVLRIAGPQFSGDVALSPNGRFVAVGGQGLLVVDLLNPARRAFYSHVYNNIGCVRFSPGGRLLAASSYDGRVRLFELLDSEPSPAMAPDARRGLDVQLRKELRHTGSANVYTLAFEPDGLGLVSASGDQTVRWFRAAGASAASTRAPEYFRTLAQWRRDEPRAALAWPPAPEPTFTDGHYQPAALRRAARPSRLQPGRYSCKISAMYRLRECVVTQDASGHTLLEFTPGNLLSLKGVVYDDGPVVRFEGWLTEPSTLIDCRGCTRQPIHGVLRGNGGRYRGVISFRNYRDPYAPPPLPSPDVKIEEAEDRYPVELVIGAPPTGAERPTERRTPALTQPSRAGAPLR